VKHKHVSRVFIIERLAGLQNLVSKDYYSDMQSGCLNKSSKNSILREKQRYKYTASERIFVEDDKQTMIA
jgi:hypothetical protein